MKIICWLKGHHKSIYMVRGTHHSAVWKKNNGYTDKYGPVVNCEKCGGFKKFKELMK